MLVDIIAHQEFVKDLYEDSKSSLTSHSVGGKVCKMQGNQSETKFPVSILATHPAIKLMNGLKSTLLQPLLTLLQFQSALLQIY